MLRGIPWFVAMQKLKRILREKEEEKREFYKTTMERKKESRKLEERR